MIPDLPFPAATYRERRAGVCDAMAERALDLLYVTSPANLLYLTGYEASWYPPRLPVGVLIDRHGGTATLFDWTRHEGYASRRVLCDDLMLFDYGHAPETVAAALAQRGWARASIGIEWSSPTPVAAITMALAGALEAAGARIVSGDWIVDTVRLYKSDEEIALIRRAGTIADTAMTEISRELRPGMTAIEVSSRLSDLLVHGGSSYAAMPPPVSAGPTAAYDVHAPPSNRAIEIGDVVGVDCCAVVDGYHANLARSFLIGGGDHPARAWLEQAAAATRMLCEAARLDEGPETAVAAAEAHIRASVPAGNVWWVGGYALGLALAPSWVGHTYLANDGPEKCRWLPGYVSNFETIFLDAAAGFAAEAIDTVVMTPNGLQVLSTLPRTMVDVPL